MTLKISGMMTAAVVMLAAALLSGCGTASADSKQMAATGVSPNSGYAAGQPVDPGSPALASSTETKYSRDQAEKEAPSKAAESSNK